MKTKMLLMAALLAAATLSANAGIHFGFSIGLPAPVVVAVPAPVVAAPVYAAPVYAGPVYAAPVYASGYVWAPGYWSVCATGRVWVPGCWHYRGGYVCGHGDWGHYGGWHH